jgi:hypothetical protein
MTPEKKVEVKFTEATEKTTGVLQGLQARRSSEEAARPAAASGDELGWQLDQYFSPAPAPSPRTLNEIRERVITGVADKILRAWQEPGGQTASPSIQAAVVDLLIERVLENFTKGVRS